MKMYLDLLPENRKKAIARKKRLKNIIKQEVVFLLPVVLFIAILFSINLILKVQNDGMGKVYLSNGAQNNYQDLKLYEDGFRSVNSKATDINSFQESHLRWSVALGSIMKVIPDGIYLSDLSTNDYQMFLVGKAKQREILIDFQNKLSEDGCFENINVPLANLVVKNDIDFQMDFQVKKDCITETNK